MFPDDYQNFCSEFPNFSNHFQSDESNRLGAEFKQKTDILKQKREIVADLVHSIDVIGN